MAQPENVERKEQRLKGGNRQSVLMSPSGSSILVGLLLALVFLCADAVQYYLHDDLAARQHLGAEYFNIAQALVDGRGFSDPFGEPTGPTAWMPPALPMLLAALLMLFGSRAAVAVAVQVLMLLTCSVLGVLVFNLCRRHCRVAIAWGAVLFYALWIVGFPYWFVVLTSDVWLISVVLCLLAMLAIEQCGKSEFEHPARWGFLGGAAALVSPASFFAWGCTMLVLVPKSRRWLQAAALAVALSAPWTVRNWVQFQRVIPTKSNLDFELHHANVVDDDGVYDLRVMVTHPYNDFSTRYEYARVGETRFIAEHGEQFRSSLKVDPLAFVRRILHRTRVAVFRYEPLLPEERFEVFLVLKRALYLVPLVFLVSGLVVPGPNRRRLAGLGVVWFSYLFPYIVVAFYARYFFPLVPVVVLVFGLALDRLLASRATLRGLLARVVGGVGSSDA